MNIDYVPMEGFTEPTRGSEGAACWDLYAAQDTLLEPYKPTLVPLAFSAKVPDGHTMLLIPRSSVGLKRNLILPNSVGVIDSDYAGQWMGIFTWIPHPAKILEATTTFSEIGVPTTEISEKKHQFHTVLKGERIAQALLVEYKEQAWRKVDALPKTKRGTGGFGSTDSVSEPRSSAV